VVEVMMSDQDQGDLCVSSGKCCFDAAEVNCVEWPRVDNE
jgi:hypothetical protein